LLRLINFSRTRENKLAESGDGRSWSVKLREAHEGSRWVSFQDSHILLDPNGYIIAINSPVAGKLEGKAALAFAKKELGWQ
jgi:hypothetical protein